MMRKAVSILLFTVLVSGLQAQFFHQDVLPELEGEDLLSGLIDEYKAQILFMDYGRTRDTLFSNVYRVNDSIRCVYSGHTLYMDPDKDPTSTVFMNGAPNGINTEHTFPRSKGAEFGNPKTDMHHLFPTRSKVNEERSNFPFAEIDDDETDLWFYQDQSMFEKPENNIDEYSEWVWQKFEPREDHKGNVARAMMYFYTMYKPIADSADPDFFNSMVPTLCDWHYQDPVDSAEWARTFLIAQYQQYPNPFVLDCSLAGRSYCDFISSSCNQTVSTKEFKPAEFELVKKVYYSFEAGKINIDLELEDVTHLNYRLYTVNGQILQKSRVKLLYPGAQSIQLDTGNIQGQMVFLNLIFESSGNQINQSVKVWIP